MATNQKKRRANIRQAVGIVVVLALLVAGVSYLYTTIADARYLKGVFVNPQGDTSAVVKLEVAVSPAERAKGLMYRNSLEPDRGMIFVFPTSSVQSFWMKDTFVSLDMIFLSAELEVVGILADVPIQNTEKRSVSSPSKYVIELPAGTAQRYKITTGTRFAPRGEVPEAIS